MRTILSDHPVKPGWARQALLDEQPEYKLIKIEFFQKLQLIKIQDAANARVPAGKSNPETKPADQIGRCEKTAYIISAAWVKAAKLPDTQFRGGCSFVTGIPKR
jgi:hypothetical protein